jgi:hypothetical protein
MNVMQQDFMGSTAAGRLSHYNYFLKPFPRGAVCGGVTSGWRSVATVTGTGARNKIRY